MEAGFIKPEASIDAVLSIDNPNPELKYIQEIVGNDYSYRDKLILLCGCIEPYIYAQVGLDPNGNLKNDLDIKVDKSNKLDSNYYYLLMIYTVTAIIFKNFNNDRKSVWYDSLLYYCVIYNHIGLLFVKGKE